MKTDFSKNTHGLETVMLRNAFYRDHYYHVLFAVIILKF